MRNPIPNNRLVAFTLAGAILTGVVAAGLAFPAFGFAQPLDSLNSDSGENIVSTQQISENVPEVNQDFTPNVKTESNYEGEHEGGEYEDVEHEDDGEYEEGGEYEDVEHEDDGEYEEDGDYEDDD